MLEHGSYRVAVLDDEVVTDPPAELAVCACGAVTAPDGTCLEIGACPRADRAATRGATGAPSAFRAWTASGRVD